MSCNIARRAKKVFKSSKLKKGIYHYDKTDPGNIKFPVNIDNVKDETLNNIVTSLVEKYKKLKYQDFDREELSKHKEWNDLQVLLLIKFYKNDWSIAIEDEEKFFPHFVFTFNPDPLKKKIDSIISYCHDHIDEDFTREKLESSYSWTGLDVTHLLHYFVIAHPEHIKEDEIIVE